MIFFHNFFQEPYNQITFEIVGDDAAPTYFEIDPTKGEIKIKRDIKSDTETQYQVLWDFYERDNIPQSIDY